MTGRGGEVARPRRRSDWRMLYADRSAEKGWRDLCAAQPGPSRALFDRLEVDPTSVDNPDRQHQLKGSLATVTVGGTTLPQWQFELGGGARVWCAVDVKRRTVHFTRCATAHPNETK